MKLTRMTVTVATVAALLGTAACGSSGGDPLATKTSSSSAGGGSSSGITVGSADFPESALLAEIYAGALEAKGVKVTKRLNIGAREAYIPALQDGSIDLIPEYTGVLTQYFNKNAKATDADGVYTELKSSLPATLTVLDKSAAEDKDALVMKKSKADQLGVKSIADLKGKSQDLTVGGPPEWKTRLTGLPGFKKIYGLEFKSFRPLDAGGPLTLAALKNGQIDAGDLFTTDPNIAANDLVALEDPKSMYAAQNVVPLITKSKSNDTIAGALNAVSAKLDTATLAALLKEVVVDKKDASAVAKEFLGKNGLG
ncbi:ABC transporter substrate-binding protein [Phycicoccus sp. 3266]|uniref:ABC transporter substrate-binding protein n=1 Tax=Phycicoccus sp. 3266 TaxID=2817751 RepID=UPI0028634C23|nr:ABC transporter substrate-binding protein [Phycicoccus sp. 3266]MDR6863393.1 osmoprotectant transport system substrate-binding protein [Phycicoccus sp. 3266]